MSNNEEEDSEISDFLDILIDFLEQIGTKIDLVINLFNKRGSNVTHKEISKVTGLSIDKTINFRDALASIAFHYDVERETWEQETKKLSEEKQDRVRKMVTKLNPNGMRGLVLLYEMMINTENPFLLGLDCQLLLSQFYSKNRKYYLPQVRIKVDYLDLENEQRSETYYSSFDTFNSVVEVLNSARDQLKEVVSEYREKIGAQVITIGGDKGER